MKSVFANNFGSFEKMGVQMEMTDAQLNFPWDMKDGDQLEDAIFEIKTKQDGRDFMTIKSIVKDRKVEGMEKVTTPAGSWNCFKLKETRSTITEMMGKQISTKEVKTVQWFTPVAGLVKYESYTADGKVQDRSELISLK